jgi:acyl-CoA dehydrogenase
MDILKYTEDHKAFRSRARAFMEKEVLPNVDTWEREGIVPKSIWKRMGAAGFLCTDVSPEYGGMGGDFLYSVIVLEELMRTNHSGLMAQLHSDVVVPYIASYGSEEIKRKYLPGCVSGDIVTAVAMTEPDAGSDLAAMTTTAVEEGEEVVINGAKTFISNGINCDLVVVAAKDPAQHNPYEAISLYLVEDGTPGFKKGKKLEKLGFHSQDTAELSFSNCRIPARNILSEKGSGFFLLMDKLQQERLICAIGAVAGAEFVLDQTVRFCKETIRDGRPLTKMQSISFKLVEMMTEVKIGRTFLDKLIADHMEGLQIIVETSMAKYWTTDMAVRIADQCLDLYGAQGMLESCPIVRAWRDVRVMPIFAGTNEIMKSIAAKFMGL